MGRRRHLQAALACALLLTACGGGSDEPEGDLYVSFNYPQTTELQLFQSVDVRPVVSGLDGRKPSFRHKSESGPLPQGFTFSTSDGAIGGYAAQAGNYLVFSELTVAGYEGTLTQVPSFRISTDIRLSYPFSSGTTTFGTAITPLTPTVSGTLPGDAVTNFRIRPNVAGATPSSLPPGVSLDPQTGTVSGTPTSRGTYVAFVQATVVRGDRQATIESGSYLYFSVQ
ncbi:putative Ig domain-containing protein [Ramlibacter tataouinensis]|uniref:Uncharacterized protein n=1 Tax=Ramlibacter tataouinensis (strain ATCC BAA-407 / DSM 14655 / LMG 21543 / TTB310) TaxID=365046 RepID=F5XWA3_RAMTT|nr:putative Ig domain-containing protein [Ramlibacter tataouinensis]AEG91673.1 Hypothetical protein Rta_05950 [Ramlibacter tataouinensis TTB310]